MRFLRRKATNPSRDCERTVIAFSDGQLYLRLSDGSRWRAKDGVSLEIENLGGGELFEEAFDLLEDGPAELRPSPLLRSD